MSGLALLAKQLGAQVSGCDRAASEFSELLEREGIEVAIGHDVSHAEAGVEMVYSTAIPADLPELAAAGDMGAILHHRADLLAAATSLRRVIAVSGTHGKTTTTAMIAHCLRACGLDPGYAVGAALSDDDGNVIANAALGSGEWMVVEADESDRSFLLFDPELAVITSVELDHHTTYSSRYEFEQAFRKFAQVTTDRGGTVVVWRPVAERLGSPSPSVTFGLDATADLRAEDVVYGRETTFKLWWGRTEICEVRLTVPGEHNVLNALAALAVCEAAGVDVGSAAAALAGFQPAGRRFERLGQAGGAEIVDDYAHHPTEIEAALAAARAQDPQRLVAIFQPHLYSRTLAFHRELGRALAGADEIFVLDVYAAREPREGRLADVSGKLVADAAADAAGGRPVWWLPTLDETEPVVRRRLRPVTLVLTLGAGDVTELAHRLADGQR
jgi:UDP-N-acetylmuramate--alanine ligase